MCRAEVGGYPGCCFTNNLELTDHPVLLFIILGESLSGDTPQSRNNLIAHVPHISKTKF